MNQTRRILIADDDPAILHALTFLLHEKGYEVIVVADGNEVYNYLSPAPHLFILDIWMSGTDGRHICRSLKNDPATGSIPVLIVSANKDIVAMSAEAGADDFIAKPFQIDELLEKIEKLIS